MYKYLWNTASIGRSYIISTMIYVLLGIAAIANTQSTYTYATGDGCNGETPCGDDQRCCNGNCVPATTLCCEDGTSGNAETCTCCGEPSTVSCNN